jgi:hypothetical protein
LLINGARAFASQQLHRRRWRGAFGGVLPDGYDADSIAAEAVAEVWKRPRKAPVEFHTAADELRRLVSKHVDRLRHRKENSLLRNEADLALVLTDDGELISLIESLPAPETGPAETLIRQQDAEAGQFRASLGKERRLKTLFDLLSAGITRRKALARKLRLRVRTVENLRKCLGRRWAAFSSSAASAKTRGDRKKVAQYHLDLQLLATAPQKTSFSHGGKRILASLNNRGT